MAESALSESTETELFVFGYAFRFTIFCIFKKSTRSSDYWSSQFLDIADSWTTGLGCCGASIYVLEDFSWVFWAEPAKDGVCRFKLCLGVVVDFTTGASSFVSALATTHESSLIDLRVESNSLNISVWSSDTYVNYSLRQALTSCSNLPSFWDWASSMYRL